ncbi:hypothetical protein GNI_027150 [Gregarina niphandrodes]|uniref:Transmembrane protein n=1 Tax=Gregarina niphandrodes TaxID=110365 RepID=A0A023BBG3_GRENI|nr:hypothetical protein GNI_027150 [Gregarina niphandrodes]EZG79305.1 hypothetical protein GNI_027150 [Gregarina niphandrodes]|eukprot:XP_011129074.1 hypothetical protein GNI_027150 [Gregarina niphandrodes]
MKGFALFAIAAFADITPTSVTLKLADDACGADIDECKFEKAFDALEDADTAAKACAAKGCDVLATSDVTLADEDLCKKDLVVATAGALPEDSYLTKLQLPAPTGDDCDGSKATVGRAAEVDDTCTSADATDAADVKPAVSDDGLELAAGGESILGSDQGHLIVTLPEGCTAGDGDVVASWAAQYKSSGGDDTSSTDADGSTTTTAAGDKTTTTAASDKTDKTDKTDSTGTEATDSVSVTTAATFAALVVGAAALN